MKRVLVVLLVLSACGRDPADPGFPPDASELSAEVSDSLAVVLEWTSFSEAESFQEYVLYRSSSQSIPEHPDRANVLCVNTDITDTTYVDTGITWVDTVYYCLQNVDDQGDFSFSEVIAVRPLDSLETRTCSQVQGQHPVSPFEGEVVAVTGTVVCGTGILDVNYTIISDPDGGPWSGLVLNSPSISFELGDSILVIGEVEERNEMTMIEPPMHVELISEDGTLPPFCDVSTADLAASCDPEYWEAVLVHVSDAVVQTTSSSGYIVDDGSGDCLVGNMSDIPYYPGSMDTLGITGIVMQDRSDWTLEPRYGSDVQVEYQGFTGHSGLWLNCAQVQGSGAATPFEGQTITVTAVVSAASDDYPGMVGWGYGIPLTFTCAFLTDRLNGPRHGLLVTWDPDDHSWTLERGDNVVVSGSCSENLLGGAEYWSDGWGPTDNTSMYLGQVTHLPSVHPQPPPVNVNGSYLACEDYEGVLVSVNDAVVMEKLASHKIVIGYDQGSRSCRVYDYPLSVSVGDSIQQITGIVWFNTSLEEFILRPRDAGDIIE